LNPSQPRRKHAEKMIPHPIEAPLGLGSRVEEGFLVSRVWGEREHGRE